MDTKKKPKLKLVGTDGNAFSILGKADKALRQAGYPKEERDNFFKEATADDYDHLLRTVMKWCECS